MSELSYAERQVRSIVINAAAHAYALTRDYGDETHEDCGPPARPAASISPLGLPKGGPQHHSKGAQ